MRRLLTVWTPILAAFVAMSGGANAQTPAYKPIDTSKLLVAPADTATNIFSRTSQYVSRAVAGTIESNGFVRTINNLLGRSGKPAPTQPGYSPLPDPTTYSSTYYQNSFKPMLPTTQQYGQTPTSVPTYGQIGR